MSKMLEEIHPGEILLEEFMKPKEITARQFSADIDVPPSCISDIVNGRRPITADTALRLGVYFQLARVSGSTCNRSKTCAWRRRICCRKLPREFGCCTRSYFA